MSWPCRTPSNPMPTATDLEAPDAGLRPGDLRALDRARARCRSAPPGGTSGSWTGPWATRRSRSSSSASSTCCRCCTRPPTITRHLREYFAEAGDAPARLAARSACAGCRSDGLLGQLLARRPSRTAERLARRFIAGSNLDEALHAIARLRRRSLAFTVDLLGEATITEAEAEQYQARVPRPDRRA